MLWHRARQKECKETRFQRLWWPWGRSEANPSLPVHEQHKPNRRKTRWQDHALSIQIFKGILTTLSLEAQFNFMQGSNRRGLALFGSSETPQYSPQEPTENPGIKIELSSNSSFHVNNEVPRRIRQELCTIKNKPVPGWGIGLKKISLFHGIHLCFSTAYQLPAR